MYNLEAGARLKVHDPLALGDISCVETAQAPISETRLDGPPTPPRDSAVKGSWRWLAPTLAGTAAALGAAALWTWKKARDAERKYPPIGRFLEVDGVRLHYIEHGHG